MEHWRAPSSVVRARESMVDGEEDCVWSEKMIAQKLFGSPKLIYIDDSRKLIQSL